jgi:hypothetical protein
VFCIICIFNDLRVAKMPLLATPARSICRLVFSGTVSINFSRARIQRPMRPTCFAQSVKILLSSASGDNDYAGQQIDALLLFSITACRSRSSVDDYRNTSLAIIPARFQIEQHSQTNPVVSAHPGYPIAQRFSALAPNGSQAMSAMSPLSGDKRT